jgi:hypothetical protein
MSSASAPSRRAFLQVSSAAMASLGVAAIAGRAAAADTSPVLQAARRGLERFGADIPHHDLVAVADFARASREPRFHLVDMQSGSVESLLVAHGRGSDPAHTGWLKSFSNVPGSAATSEGCYLTSDPYIGGHGRSMRLKGLEPTNSNAESRAIVVHAAWYVSPEMARVHGVLGRSEGCFAVSDADLPKVMSRLGPGRLIVATRL